MAVGHLGQDSCGHPEGLAPDACGMPAGRRGCPPSELLRSGVVRAFWWQAPLLPCNLKATTEGVRSVIYEARCSVYPTTAWRTFSFGELPGCVVTTTSFPSWAG